VNVAQLQAWAAQNKVALLGVGAAGAVLLGLRTRSRASGGAKQPAGTLPAAAVVPANGLQATGSTYDSSAYDVYNALQSELGPFLQAQANQTGTSSGVTSVPPIASTLFRPSGTGQYAQYGNGTVAEIESDGSQLGLTYGQWNDLIGTGAKVTQVLPVGAPAGNTAYYETSGNLANVKKPAA
jgi:hypothetical protein